MRCCDDLAESWLEARGWIDTTVPGRRLIDTLTRRLWAWFDANPTNHRLLMLDPSAWPSAGIVVRAPGAPEQLLLQLCGADADPVHAMWRRVFDDLVEHHGDASFLGAA